MHAFCVSRLPRRKAKGRGLARDASFSFKTSPVPHPENRECGAERSQRCYASELHSEENRIKKGKEPTNHPCKLSNGKNFRDRLVNSI